MAQGAPAQLDAIVVRAARSAQQMGVADSATEGEIGARQLAPRPLLRAAEVLESVPGMTVTQHSGDGKANQYFLRGFNLDHGSDFASFVAGVPVNVASHAHGQGYSDLNFLIPELVRSVRYRKGSYAAEDGDFAVTGSARMDYLRRLDAPFAEIGAGSGAWRRVLVAGGLDPRPGQALWGALELGRTDGPWEQPERLRRTNAVLRFSTGSADEGLVLTLMSYRAKWTATEQVPQRAIDDGEIGRYGTLAPTDGGRTARDSLSLELTHGTESGRLRASAYLLHYRLDLFSTPSGLQDPQHEQEDRRRTAGGQLAWTWPAGDSEFLLGTQLRDDRVPRIGLFLTRERERTETVREDRLHETAKALFAEARTPWTPTLRSVLGLRVDRVAGRVTPRALPGDATSAGATQWSPRLSLAFGPFGATEFYANAGAGFHSNDLRGAASAANVPLLARARSAELGLRSSPLAGWNLALSLWRTRLASELVFVGDEGVTEPRGASRRRGLELSNDWALGPALTLDADAAFSRARFEQAEEGGGTRVPNAVPRSASVGLAADAGGRWTAGLRLRHIGAYALEETGTQRSRPLTTVNLKLGFRPLPQWQLGAELLNLLGSRGHDIAYWGTSCTPREGTACRGGAGVDGRLVHPLEPRTLRLTLRAPL